MISVHNIIFFSSFITELKNTIETQINEVKQQIEGELDPYLDKSFVDYISAV